MFGRMDCKRKIQTERTENGSFAPQKESYYDTHQRTETRGQSRTQSDGRGVRYYAEEWRVEWSFKGKKRPVMVERLFMKDVGKAEALITIVNIAALVRAILRLLLRRGVDSLSDDELYDLKGVDSHINGRLIYDKFMVSCMIRYDSATNNCRFFNSTTDRKASHFCP